MNQLHRRTAINEAVEVLPTPGVPVSRIFGRFLCGPSSLIGKKEGGSLFVQSTRQERSSRLFRSSRKRGQVSFLCCFLSPIIEINWRCG